LFVVEGIYWWIMEVDWDWDWRLGYWGLEVY